MEDYLIERSFEVVGNFSACCVRCVTVRLYSNQQIAACDVRNAVLAKYTFLLMGAFGLRSVTSRLRGFVQPVVC